MRRYGIPLIAMVLAALGLARGGVLSAEGSSGSARLTAISSTAEGRRAAVLIEASEPVAYLTSQPDPSTFVVDLRNVHSTGFANGFTARAGSPVRAVSVEDARGAAGEPLARVRVALAGPLTPRVRSQRNLIFVEIDGDTPVATAAATVAPLPDATTLESLRTEVGPRGVSLRLGGSGALVPSAVRTMSGTSHRVVLDFPNVTPAVPSVTTVKQGPVERVRVALNSREPLVTRVVVDLAREAQHTLAPAADGRSVTLTFATDGPVAPGGPTQVDAMAAIEQAPAAAAPAPAASPAPRTQPPASSTPPPAPSVQAGPPLPTSAPIPNDTQTMTRSGEKTYSGHPVSLDFTGADLRAVLRTFAEISGLNMVIDPSVQGSVDVALRDVPWDQALEIILRANKLGYSVDGTIVRVAPLSVLADEEKQRRKLAEEQALSGEIRVLTRTLSYAKAEDIRSLLLKSALSTRGTVEVDPRTNTLIMSDLAGALDTATNLITTLDKPQPQVEIEARIVQTTSDFARAIGVQWGINGRASPALGNTTPWAFPNHGSISGRTGLVDANALQNAVNLPVAAATSAIGLTLGSVNGSFNVDVALSALEKTGKGRLLSSPRVATQNNIEAEIMQGVQIPIQTVANNTVTVTFKDAALTLKVTPQITSANTVIMKITLENASPDYSKAVGTSAIPPIDTQRAVTQVLVNDGQTTVIGGIYVSREQSAVDGVPYLNRIPLLGWLFKRDSVQDEKRELLIFITPRILRS
jgi:type IV pilus assembly protein PilQ